MAEIVHFTPKAGLTAAENLGAFVAMARDQLTVFGADLHYDDVVWHIFKAGHQRGINHPTRITFCTLATVKSKAKKANDKAPMAEPFCAFAKACVRYLQGLQPALNPQVRLSALRALEQALTENGGTADPVRIDATLFNRAGQLVKGHFSKAAAYRIGGQLEIIADLLRDKRLTTVPTVWRNPITRPSDSDRVGKAFDEGRDRKMPTPTALDAVAIAFRTATVPGDVIRISAAALMCGAPDRVGEVLTMRAACEVYQSRSNDEIAYGLRWWPSKGAEPMVKWIIPSMAGIVQDALANIRRHTDEARRIAAWYEANPTQLYLPEEFQHLRLGQVIPFDDASALLGLKPETMMAWAKKNGVAVRRSGIVQGFDFAQFERVVIAMLPATFPVLDNKTGLKFSEGLFVALHRQFRTDRTPCRCMIETVDQHHLADALGSMVRHGGASAFSRLKLTEPDGSPIIIRSHQFRHWLNTLAQRGGLSQLDIAKWSGRKDIRQNRAYDHMSGDEILALVRKSVTDDDQLFGALVAYRPNAPVSRDEFARMLVPTAHATESGFCVHDYTALPCQLKRDCINCHENVCIKGDKAKTDRLRKRVTVDRELLAKAERAAKQRIHGADRWLEHHRVTVARGEQLLALMEDPTIPDGTVIRLASEPGQSFLLHPEAHLIAASVLPDAIPDATGSLALEELRGALEEMD